MSICPKKVTKCVAHRVAHRRSPTERFQFSHIHFFFMFILIMFTPLLTPLLFSKGFSSRQYSLHYFFDQQKTFGNYVQTILGCQYFDELNGTQSRIASHYVITRSYTLVQASDNPRQKCWDKIDYWEQIQLSQRAYHPPTPPVNVAPNALWIFNIDTGSRVCPVYFCLGLSEACTKV